MVVDSTVAAFGNPRPNNRIVEVSFDKLTMLMAGQDAQVRSILPVDAAVALIEMRNDLLGKSRSETGFLHRTHVWKDPEEDRVRPTDVVDAGMSFVIVTNAVLLNFATDNPDWEYWLPID